MGGVLTSSRRRGTEHVTQVGEVLRSEPDWHIAPAFAELRRGKQDDNPVVLSARHHRVEHIR